MTVVTAVTVMTMVSSDSGNSGDKLASRSQKILKFFGKRGMVFTHTLPTKGPPLSPHRNSHLISGWISFIWGVGWSDNPPENILMVHASESFEKNIQ